MAAHGEAAPSLGPVRRGTTVRHYMLLLVATVLGPVLLLAGVLAQRTVELERSRFQAQVVSHADAALIVIQRELLGLMETLQALTVSRALDEGNYQAFHQQASELMQAVGIPVILRNTSGQQLANTLVPWGGALPNRSSLTAWDSRVINSRRPVITGHYVGLTGRTHSFAVVTPVLRDGRVIYMLHLSVPVRRLQGVLEGMATPAGWATAVTDQDGVILARSRRHDEAVGRPATQGDALPPLGGSAQGNVVNRDEEEAFFAARRLLDVGWGVVVTAPIEQMQAPVRRVLLAGAAIGSALLGMSLLAAWVLGSRLASAIHALAAAGASFSEGEVVRPASTPIREVNEVGEALARAALERAAADERRRLILLELNHRVKNTLATVQAIATLTARGATDVETYREQIVKRLDGLARTQDLLTSTNWAGADMRDLLQIELSMHTDAGRQRITLDGPPVNIPAQQVVALGMVVHELATNAAKYGALSVPGGRLAVSWQVRTRDGDPAPQLDLLWQEADGPPTKAPARTGFGTQMIQRGLARQLGATVAADYQPSGLQFRLSMPLRSRQGAETMVAGPRPGVWAHSP
ncbi:sensor histidine kinase [Belnapia sp. T6]|uniref:histidine kinase n=1 Tax=Belnapia mucosa TaxID=2804532 RepID=A0ABS1V9E5_9PROT|nr:sensor histidine kinase [Belnapia mucosa]MBL6458306.1 sensor histidine kinase [Belnapia mucosa]